MLGKSFHFPTDKTKYNGGHTKGVLRGCGILIADVLPEFSTSAQRVQLLLFRCVDKLIKNSLRILFFYLVCEEACEEKATKRQKSELADEAPVDLCSRTYDNERAAFDQP